MNSIAPVGLDAVRGEVVFPSDPSYQTARMAWNLALDQRPSVVVTPLDAQDVAAAVRAARELGLRVAPQATGHGATSRSSLEGSMLLRLDLMRDVVIDPEARRARVGGGAQWIDVVGPAAEHGLAALGGSAPDVGVVGYTLGGGTGFLARAHGLASSKVTAVEIVTAEGDLVDAGEDLLWALRGGGGSFGIVTSIEFELIELPEVFCGAMFFPIERAREILTIWRDWAPTAPEAVTTSIRLMRFPPMVPDPRIAGRAFVVLDGADLDGGANIQPFIDLEPEIDTFGMAPAPALQQIHMDPPMPVPFASEHTLLDSVDDAAIEAVLDVAGPDAESMLMFIELRQFGGALGRPVDGAISKIDAPFSMYAVAAIMAPEMLAPCRAQLAAARAAVSRGESGRELPNFTDHPRATCVLVGEASASRLSALRAHVDPDRLLHANHAVA